MSADSPSPVALPPSARCVWRDEPKSIEHSEAAASSPGFLGGFFSLASVSLAVRERQFTGFWWCSGLTATGVSSGKDPGETVPSPVAPSSPGEMVYRHDRYREPGAEDGGHRHVGATVGRRKLFRIALEPLVRVCWADAPRSRETKPSWFLDPISVRVSPGRPPSANYGPGDVGFLISSRAASSWKAIP